MIKVLIVDDEIWECRLIRKIIKWDELGLEVVGEAYDGLNACELIMSNSPQIVITDIRMPVLDGIELIKKVRESNIEISFIVVSGHNDFGYIQSALRHSVEDYILKPVDEAELTNTLIKVCERILSKQKDEKEKSDLKLLSDSSLNKLRKQLFTKLLYNHIPGPLNLENINNEFKFQFKEQFFQIMVFKLDNKASKKADTQLNGIVLEKLASIVKNNFENICCEIFYLTNKSEVVLIANYFNEKQKSVDINLKVAFNDARNYINIYKQYYLTLGVGCVVTDIKDLGKSFQLAHNSIKCRIFEGFDRIIDVSKLEFKSLKLGDLLSVEKEKQFVSLIGMLNIKEVLNIIQEAFIPYMSDYSLSPVLIYDLSYKIVQLLYEKLEGNGFNVEKLCVSKEIVFEDIYECKTINEILNCLLNVTESLFKFCSGIRHNQIRKSIEIANEYVSTHYFEEINLDDISKIVYMNPAYFSSLFKKEVGINFTEYLTNYRIEISKELLKNPQYNVSDVAELVGYKNPKYFSKLFRKTIGINPAEYRKYHS